MGDRDLDKRVSQLAGVELLASLPDMSLERLAKDCRWFEVPAGREVIAPEGSDDGVYFVLEGTVRVLHSNASGREVSFADIGPGNVVGELAALDGGPRTASVMSLTDALLAQLDSGKFHRLLKDEPEVSVALLLHLAGIIRDADKRIGALSAERAVVRIEAELLRLVESCHAEVGVDGRVVLDPLPSDSEIAARVSSSRETVNRTIAQLTRAGLILRRGTQLIVQDLTALQAHHRRGARH